MHESRLVANTSAYWRGTIFNAAHVFLKCEAFLMEAALSFISDLDLVVTNIEVLGRTIMDFLPNGKHGYLIEFWRGGEHAADVEPNRDRLSAEMDDRSGLEQLQ